MDWQISRFASPVFDIHEIIFTATEKPLRDREYKKLMNHYYLTLTEAIKKMGGDAAAFKRCDFDDHLRKFGPWAVIVSLYKTVVALASSKDIPDLDDLSESMGKDGNNSLVKTFDEDVLLIYSKRARELVGDLYDLGYYAKS